MKRNSAESAGVATIFEIDDEADDSVLATSSQFAQLPAERRTADDFASATQQFSVLGPLQKFSSKNIVIILDLMFPRDQNPRDGIKFIKSIRAGEQDIDCRTPIIVHSNVANRIIIAEALEAGANLFFKKTDDPGGLLDAISFFLGKEVLTHRTAWEVVQLCGDTRKIRVRAESNGRVIVERMIDFDMCPIEARIEGGSFIAETCKRFVDYEVEFVVRSRHVDAEEEREEILKILDIRVGL